MSEKTGAKIAGSWTVDIGEQDEASARQFRSRVRTKLHQSFCFCLVHLWKYPGGYETLNKATEVYRTDPVLRSRFLAVSTKCSVLCYACRLSRNIARSAIRCWEAARTKSCFRSSFGARLSREKTSGSTRCDRMHSRYHNKKWAWQDSSKCKMCSKRCDIFSMGSHWNGARHGMP